MPQFAIPGLGREMQIFHTPTTSALPPVSKSRVTGRELRRAELI